MRVAIRYYGEEISSVKEFSEITHECIEYEGEWIPLLILCSNGGYDMGSRLSMHEIGSIDGLITKALINGYVDLRDRAFEFYYDNDLGDWARFTVDSEDDNIVRTGRYYPG